MSALLHKAQRALDSAKLLLSAGDMDGAVNRAYYSMFDAAKAALTEGDEPMISQPIKSHNGLITLFSQHLVKTGHVSNDLGKHLNEVEELRLIADYKAEDMITSERAAWAVEAAEGFVRAMDDLIDDLNQPSPGPSMWGNPENYWKSTRERVPMTKTEDTSEQSPLERFLKFNHPGLTESDLEPTGTPGYWRIKGGCPGGENCRHAFRGSIGPCAGGGDLTILFSQPGRDKTGRFLRPNRYWERVTQNT